MSKTIAADFSEARNILELFIAEPENMKRIEDAGNMLVTAFKNGKKVLSCGNGGSMCDAMHFAEELSGRFREDRPALPAICISDSSYLTCVANDYGFEKIFSRGVEALGQSGDVLLAISTSGNSKNILEAAKAARKKGMKVIALTGKDGGALKSICDIEIRAPHSTYADRTQEIHIKVIHALIHFTEDQLK